MVDYVLSLTPMTNRIHANTSHAAQQYAKQKLGGDVELRPATTKEKVEVTARQLDNEKVVDAVVARDSKGNEYLLGVVDDAKTRHLNQESAVATAIGLIPIVGPPLAATIALKDIVKAGIPIVKAKAAGEATDPADRALMRMGLKHLGLSAVSMASHGAAHYVMMGVEAAAASKDLGDSKPTWRELPKSMWNALKSLFSVKAHEDHTGHDSLRVVMVKQLTVAPPPLEKGAGNPEETAGPPSSAS